VSKLLEYTPEARLSGIEAMIHPFFDELRVEGARMPNGKEFPLLFDFTHEGEFEWDVTDLLHRLTEMAELSVQPELNRRLVPPHCEPELASRSIVLDNFVPIPLEQLKIMLD
jgi:glycogen synthase kinase 3 beta